eukprot:CAMPEP_0172696468 /NCGR_PEP_ID=MMETSP1074-20121228/28073_1 /TAXON_ID=2916 /ORGANISM="Ceratium fusus, Strain PA161109" /LENGTH=66 /DNA_ID=CAMNT_0013517217 /DNA_START=577 /DNA_END=777 /DNA_ORIENTATION=-
MKGLWDGHSSAAALARFRKALPLAFQAVHTPMTMEVEVAAVCHRDCYFFEDALAQRTSPTAVDPSA